MGKKRLLFNQENLLFEQNWECYRTKQKAPFFQLWFRRNMVNILKLRTIVVRNEASSEILERFTSKTKSVITEKPCKE